MNSYYNKTEPLPFNSNVNKFYDHYPDEKQLVYETALATDNGLKRIKSYKSLNNTSLARKSSIKKTSRRKGPLIYLSTLSQSSTLLSNRDCSIYESSNYSSSSESDDLESLPDLVNDDTDTTELSSPMSIRVPSVDFFFLENPRKLEFVPQKKPIITTPQINIFNIPEIVYKIIEFASYQNDITNQPISRRKPETFNHALLIHGNREAAKQAMNKVPPNSFQVLSNCLLVNKLFNQVTKDILNKRFFFDNETKLYRFLKEMTGLIRPKEFKLHKLYQMKNSVFNQYLSQFNFENLTTLEIFMCPKFLPSREFFVNGVNIKHIVICGSNLLDDNYLIDISRTCPNLETIDFRGCEMITDTGIYHIAMGCSKLTTINFGRKNRGHLITDASVGKLIKNNPNLSTIGLAGCHITDKTVWDISIHCNYRVERLSLNNCPLLTNQCLPLILMTDYLENLNVLEMKHTNITNLKPIIEFKRKQEFKGIPILIEVCELLCYKMRQQEVEMDKIISARIFEDIQEWANDSNDGDSSYLPLLNSRS